MIFLPYDRFTIQTSLTPDQVRQKLSSELETAPSVSWNPPTTNKAYQGTVGENKFEITPLVFYNRSTPAIKGDILSEIGGTQIKVRMLPRLYLTIYMVLSLGVLGFIFFRLLAAWFFSTGTFYIFPARELLQIGGWFIFVYSFLVGGFKFQANKSKKHLKELLGAREEQR